MAPWRGGARCLRAPVRDSRVTMAARHTDAGAPVRMVPSATAAGRPRPAGPGRRAVRRPPAAVRPAQDPAPAPAARHRAAPARPIVAVRRPGVRQGVRRGLPTIARVSTGSEPATGHRAGTGRAASARAPRVPRATTHRARARARGRRASGRTARGTTARGTTDHGLGPCFHTSLGPTRAGRSDRRAESPTPTARPPGIAPARPAPARPARDRSADRRASGPERSLRVAGRARDRRPVRGKAPSCTRPGPRSRRRRRSPTARR